MAADQQAHRVSPTPLKDQNRYPLLAILVINLLVLSIVVKTGALPSWDVADEWQGFLPAGIGVIAAAVVNGLLSPNTKARLVFWRWHNPLPGSRAFSRYAGRDPRIDVSALQQHVGTFPAEPNAQNAMWYRLYKSVESEPAVTDAHRYFLLTRDYTAMAFLLLVVAGVLGIWLIAPAKTAMIYVGILLAQYLLARQAAQNYGVRLVTTVLALKAAR